jgi:putative transposase
MVLRQAYKYRLNTKPVDELLMKQFSGCCRFVWNKALALQKERLDAGERTLSYNKLAVLLAALEERKPVPGRCPFPGVAASAEEPGPSY